MWIEAVSKPIRLRCSTGSIRLEPGKPIRLTEHYAKKLLARACEMVRVIEHDRKWLTGWQELAQLTGHITRTDYRYSFVLKALDQCDHAFEADNWPAFQHASERVKQLVKGA